MSVVVSESPSLTGMGLPPPIDPRGYTIHDLRRAYPEQLRPYSNEQIAQAVYRAYYSRMRYDNFVQHFLRPLPELEPRPLDCLER